jgi:hypothetical protein
MKPLEELSLGNRIALTLAIVLIILFALAITGYLTGGWDEADAQQALPNPPGQTQPGFCIDAITRERVRDILLTGLDEALKDQVKNLMAVWLRDERGQPGRASVGLHNAAIAYDHAREAALVWAPPLCTKDIDKQ